MYKIVLIACLSMLPVIGQTSAETAVVEKQATAAPTASSLYEEMNLSGKINAEAFEQAYNGYCSIEGRKKDILTLIDFTKPSTQERLYVFDMKKKALLFSSVVSHGRNSGGTYATEFSNQDGSHKSSLGFYLTQNTYQGRNGYSLVLEGLEKGVNDNAKRRAIVIHGAAYANPSVAKSGRLGRSFGCPALPQKMNKPIIDAIKNGSVLYIYAKNHQYMAKSSILKAPMKKNSLSPMG